ncbi:hypothetical protein PoB_000566700 [Plakobranchus ocellatus]|uniref:Uncharacterized protein n=1 Tax=Plakobranchus ocellatus TaxID=259542 RepID=A0AAV3YAL8_9GAST|nr:hypothetical protein PoB_000566700 [Plakobranchus ocellatus]
MVLPPNELSGIPGLELKPYREIRIYIRNPGLAALKPSPTEAINIKHFWNFASEAVPHLVGCTRRYIMPKLALPMLRGAFRYTTLCCLRGDESVGELIETTRFSLLHYNNLVG